MKTLGIDRSLREPMKDPRGVYDDATESVSRLVVRDEIVQARESRS
jgi:hypothetical protein